jgi:hypothetical protein
MSHAIKGVFVPAGPHALCGGAEDFRTRLARYLVDPVLPAILLLVIAAVTIATIVLIVMTVAGSFLHVQPQLENVTDPWMDIRSDSAVWYEDDLVYPGDTFPVDGMEMGGLELDSQRMDRPNYALWICEAR